ncbi:SRPBCC family protein [Marinicella sp. W31]|uniref:SRPBCC family protein n=1 Tax=Marinicella sp. W31 TaxID=3023713 RepID=UPI00375749A7
MSNAIKKTIELNAPISRVWRALTDHEEFGAWFRVRLDNPFKVGEVSTGQVTYPGYEHLVWRALVHRMDQESLFTFSWNPYDSNDNIELDKETTLVEFHLQATANGTVLTVTESGFDALTDPRRLEAFRENSKGWEEQMKNITAYVNA